MADQVICGMAVEGPVARLGTACIPLIIDLRRQTAAVGGGAPATPGAPA